MCHVCMMQVYKQLIANKPELEELLWKVQEGWGETSEGPPAQQSISPVNKYIHQAGLRPTMSQSKLKRIFIFYASKRRKFSA
jgi:hypothetical protein